MGQGISFKIQVDENHIEEWGFSFIDWKLIVDYYTVFKREDPKQAYFPIKNYERIFNPRRSMYSKTEKISEDEVPLTDNTKNLALDEFMSKIKVIKQQK